MNKRDLKVIVGGADSGAGRNEKQFIGAFATDSRLMGVLVVYIHWKPVTSGNRSESMGGFHQFFYIETSEIGLDGYKSLCGDDAVAMLEIEQTMTGGLGSSKVDISEKEAFMLVQKYTELNKKNGEELPDGISEYAFILDEKTDATEEEWQDLFLKICKMPETPYQIINYYLMRYFAGDRECIELLGPGAVPENDFEEGVYSTLCYNKIEERLEDGSLSYLNESLIETDNGYRIIGSEIVIKGQVVTAFSLISNFPISNMEAAMKLERPEFITVYEVLMDSDIVKEFLDVSLTTAMKRDTECGRLYLNFNEDNSHTKKSVYRLNDDVRGMYYLTEENQLILAAYSISQIHRLEKQAQTLPFGKKLFPLAKYEFKEDMFYDFVRSDSADFVHYIEVICEFDPENE